MKNPRLLIALFAMSLVAPYAEAQGQLPLAPPPFATGKGKAVFVDFQSALYEITFDPSHHQPLARSTIRFVMPQDGLPVFNFVAHEPTSVLVDGQPFPIQGVSPAADAGPVQVVQGEIAAGTHTLVLEHRVADFWYDANGVDAGFFTNDDVGKYLNEYLPSSFEYDTYAMTFRVEIIGSTIEHVLFTTGKVEHPDRNHWTVRFPATYNCSSGYFHLVAKAAVEALEFQVDNGAGRMIPAVVYRDARRPLNLPAFRDGAIADIAELSSRFGAFAHPKLVIFALNDGGSSMEYAGAAVSTLESLKHELAHSYFGRGVMPADGNAGWIDEAMASLTGGPYIPDPKGISRPTNMAGHSAYFTKNDRTGYGNGMNLLAHFDVLFRAARPELSMDGFLRGWYQRHKFGLVTTPMLRSELEAYSGLSLESDFNRYVYGQPTANQRQSVPAPKRAKPVP